jgi:hypothetical protein
MAASLLNLGQRSPLPECINEMVHKFYSEPTLEEYKGYVEKKLDDLLFIK